MSYSGFDAGDGMQDVQKFMVEGLNPMEWDGSTFIKTGAKMKILGAWLHKAIAVSIVWIIFSIIITFVCIFGMCFTYPGSMSSKIWTAIWFAIGVVWFIGFWVGIAQLFGMCCKGGKEIGGAFKSDLATLYRQNQHKIQPHGGGIKIGNYSLDYQFKKGY